MPGLEPRREALGDDELIDLRALIQVFQRRFAALIATGAIVLAAVVVITLQMTPTYTATARLIIDNRQTNVVDFEAVMSGLGSDSTVVDTEVEVIESRSLAETVARELNLVDVPEFNAELEPPEGFGAFLEGLKGSLRSLLPRQALGALTPEEADQIASERVTNALMDAVTARRSGLTYVINISATSESPALARDIANTYAQQYLLAQLEAKFEATERANSWLNERVEVLREEVRANEQAVADYRAQEGLLDAEGASLTEQQISDLTSQLIVQRAELAEAEARLQNVRDQIERGVSPESIGEVLRSDVIRDLRSEYSEASRELEALRIDLGPLHPRRINAERALSDIEVQLGQEVQRIVTNLENEVNVARQRVRSLNSGLADLRDELVENNSSLVRLRELEREAEASRALFESFLGRFRETNEQESIAESDARIVADAATPLEPSAPNVMLNLALGVVLAGVAGIGVVFLLETLGSALRTETDIETRLGLNHIASVPRLKPGLLKRLRGQGSTEPEDYVVQKPLSGFSESFRTIKTAVRLAEMDDPLRIVAVTSALPGEGKTITVTCLGRISAMADTATLVLDADLRRRRLTKAIAPDVSIGMLEVLSGQASLDEVIVKDEATGLHILPLSATEFTPRDVFATQAFSELLDELRRRYELVVIDTAPVLAVADTPTIASQVDGVVYATQWGKTKFETAQSAVSALKATRANIIGAVLNGVDLEAQARYGYQTSGYYYRAYRKYYAD